MTRIARSLLSAALLALAAAPACTDSGVDSSTQASTSGRAQIAVVVTGDASSSLDLVLTDHASGAVALTQHLTIAADGSVGATVELPEGDYGLELTALAEDGITVTASGMVDVAIAAEATIQLSATLDAEGGGGLETEINNPPTIAGIDIDVIHDLTAGAQALGDATLTASVTDADGDAMTYFWSGLTIQGSVEGSSSISIDNDAVLRARLAGQLDLAAGAHFFLVAQDDAGGAAVAEVTLGSNGTCLLCGTATVEIVAGAGIGIEETGERLEACLEAHVACAASCDAVVVHDGGDTSASAQCNAACGAELADCASDYQ